MRSGHLFVAPIGSAPPPPPPLPMVMRASAVARTTPKEITVYNMNGLAVYKQELSPDAIQVEIDFWGMSVYSSLTTEKIFAAYLTAYLVFIERPAPGEKQTDFVFSGDEDTKFVLSKADYMSLEAKIIETAKLVDKHSSIVSGVDEYLKSTMATPLDELGRIQINHNCALEQYTKKTTVLHYLDYLESLAAKLHEREASAERRKKGSSCPFFLNIDFLFDHSSGTK